MHENFALGVKWHGWLLFFFLNWGIVALQCCVSFCRTTKWISHMYTYISSLLNLPPTGPPPTHPTHLGHHRAPSWAPCAIQQVLTSYLFYTRYCLYVNPNLPVHPTLPSPLLVHMSVLYVCVSAPALYSQIGLSVPFFYISHICVNIRYLFFSWHGFLVWSAITLLKISGEFI